MEYSPTVRGRRLMREIIRLRTERGLSMERAASQIGWSTSKIYRLENGRSRITTDDLADMLDAYGVTSPDRDSLLQLCRDARKRGWWTAYADVFTGSYMSMETEASAISVNANIVPGVLQTTHYAHAVITATRPGMTTADAERRVAARAARQQALFSRDDPPRVHVVLDEAVLLRQVGGRQVMLTQLTALAEAAERPGIRIQVLPFAAGAHSGMDGKFSILTFPDSADPPVAYVEGLMGDVYIEADAEVERFAVAWNHLISQALNPAESAALIAEREQETR